MTCWFIIMSRRDVYKRQGEPIYELSYKGKAVIKPSKLGLELKDAPGLMNGFTLADNESGRRDIEEYYQRIWSLCG